MRFQVQTIIEIMALESISMHGPVGSDKQRRYGVQNLVGSRGLCKHLQQLVDLFCVALWWRIRDTKKGIEP